MSASMRAVSGLFTAGPRSGRATSFAGATPVSTIGLFRYEAGAQGSLTTPVTVNVTP